MNDPVHNTFIERRARLFRQSVKKTVFKRGGTTQAHYYCSICGNELSSMSRTTFKKVASCDFVRLKMDDFLTVNLCKNTASCYKRLTKEETT